MQVTIFTANCIGQAANCSYPNKVTVVTPEQLREAVKADHVRRVQRKLSRYW